MITNKRHAKELDDAYCEGFVKAWNTQAAARKTCTVRVFDDGWADKGEGKYEQVHNGEWWLSCGHFIPGDIHSRPNYCPACGARVVE